MGGSNGDQGSYQRALWTMQTCEVTTLARWLHERHRLTTVEDTIAFFEKPWKWNREYEEMCRGDEEGSKS